MASENDSARDYDDLRVGASNRARRTPSRGTPGDRPWPRRPRSRRTARTPAKSTGPKSGTDRTRFNGLKHGLCAEQVVLPGEDPAAFEAEKQAWFDDWKPATHTRAVLVERAAVASWKLRRATRVEAARLYETAADAAHEFDLAQRERIEAALHRLPSEPGSSLARLRCDAAGLDRLIGLWEELAEAAVRPGGWTPGRTTTTGCSTCWATPPAPSRRTWRSPGPRSHLLAGADPAAAAGLRAFCARADRRASPGAVERSGTRR